MKTGYDLVVYYDTGYKLSINYDIKSHCHYLITGASGSGKSYALLYLIAMILRENPDIIIYFCDFKNSEDFAFLEGYSHYYSGNNCYDGIMEYYEAFTNARKTRKNNVRHILIVDEYPAFINYLQMQDKANKTKLAGDVMSAIAEILMLGRGISYGCFIVTQRADSSLFNNGCRDNFMVIIGLGRMSKEQKSMLFSGDELPNRTYKQGEGVILADGQELQEIKFPYLENISEWKKGIFQILTRNT